jgi:hypothetical protein
MRSFGPNAASDTSYKIVYAKGACMFKVAYRVALFGFSLLASHAGPAHAQAGDDFDIVYEAARNKIGLLRHCRVKAFLDAATAATAIAEVDARIARMQVSGALLVQGDKAEKSGEAGLLFGVSGKRDLANLAVLFKTSPAGLCQEWAGETLRSSTPRSTPKSARYDLPDTPPAAQQPYGTAAVVALSPALIPPIPEKAPHVTAHAAVLGRASPPPGASRQPLRLETQIQGAPTASHQLGREAAGKREAPAKHPGVRAEELTLPSISMPSWLVASKPWRFNRREKPWAP